MLRIAAARDAHGDEARQWRGFEEAAVRQREIGVAGDVVVIDGVVAVILIIVDRSLQIAARIGQIEIGELALDGEPRA